MRGLSPQWSLHSEEVHYRHINDYISPLSTSLSLSLILCEYSFSTEALQRTVDQATNQMKLDVIYGDTDSVMINTNSTDLAEVKRLGNEVKKEVNKLYKSLELDLDGIFKAMLLLKKKKYAALVIKESEGQITYEKELKGLDLVRRDWCPLSKDTGKFIVDAILSGIGKEEIVNTIHEHLSQLAESMRGGKEDISRYVVTKGLNKNPKDYPDQKSQPHLQVALAMIAANKPVNIGDHIPYVICTQASIEAMSSGGSDDQSKSAAGTGAGTGNTAVSLSTPAQRARHPDEVIRSNGALVIDVDWYLTQQILPPIARLCEPIDGTSHAQLAVQLGLDGSKFHSKSNASDDLVADDFGFVPRSLMNDADRFKSCLPLLLHCTSCGLDVPFPGVYSDLAVSGLNCGACGVRVFPFFA
jgi:DNA polymerase alpha subunit A